MTTDDDAVATKAMAEATTADAAAGRPTKDKQYGRQAGFLSRLTTGTGAFNILGYRKVYYAVSAVLVIGSILLIADDGQGALKELERALALNPHVLLLDDFTARVDTATERKILDNVQRNYPGLTLLSVTQKIGPVEHYDQIVLLMEGEVLATGTHAELMDSCPEYVQIYDSQRSTQHYESVQA